MANPPERVRPARNLFAEMPEEPSAAAAGSAQEASRTMAAAIPLLASSRLRRIHERLAPFARQPLIPFHQVKGGPSKPSDTVSSSKASAAAVETFEKMNTRSYGAAALAATTYEECKGAPLSLGMSFNKKHKAPSSPTPSTGSRAAPNAAGFMEESHYTGSPKKRGPICPTAPKKLKAKGSSDDEVEATIQIGKPFVIRKWDDQSEMTLTPVRKLGAGDHGTAWLVRDSGGVLQVYKVDEETNASYIKEELYQYAQLREIAFPVAVHYDLETHINSDAFKTIYAIPNKSERNQALLKYILENVTHRYHLREFLEHPFPSFGSIPIESPLYDQARLMMQMVFEHGIAADLQKRNIAYNIVQVKDATGQVTNVPQAKYFDLMPHDEVDVNELGMQKIDENPFGMIVKQCLRTFAPLDHPIAAKLDPRPKS